MTTPKMAVTVDIVLFTIQERRLQVLLIRRLIAPYQNRYAIPGGFVLENESLGEAALRELREEAGVGNVYLEQLYTFGEPRRDPRGRVITVAYYALAPRSQSAVAGWASRSTTMVGTLAQCVQRSRAITRPASAGSQRSRGHRVPPT